MKGGGVAMGSRWRVDPAEEARHREVMAGLGVYDAEWALCKVLVASDVKPDQNRLLVTKKKVCGGPIPRLFPELEELNDDGLNAERAVSVSLLDADGRAKELSLRYLNSNKAYRLKGPEWRRFVQDTGMCTGDRLDLYACRRGDDGERCLFSFTSKGGGASAWCTNGRKHARQPAAADAAAVPDLKRRAKSRRAERKDHTGRVTDDACSGGLIQGDYGCCKAAESTSGDKAPRRRSWKDYATKLEKEAARGLLMLKYAILAGYYY